MSHQIEPTAEELRILYELEEKARQPRPKVDYVKEFLDWKERCEECQRDLDEYATKKGWKRVEELRPL